MPTQLPGLRRAHQRRYDAYAPGKGLYRITVVIHSIAEDGCTQYSCGYIPTACLTSGISLLNTHFRGQNSFAEEIGADTGLSGLLHTPPWPSPALGAVVLHSKIQHDPRCLSISLLRSNTSTGWCIPYSEA